MGHWPPKGQLEEVGLVDTLDLKPYLDDKQTVKIFPALKEEVTPEAGDKYVQASIMLPPGNTFAHGTVVSCKHNVEGNFIWHAHDKPMLDSCQYDIEFADGEVISLMANEGHVHTV